MFSVCSGISMNPIIPATNYSSLLKKCPFILNLIPLFNDFMCVLMCSLVGCHFVKLYHFKNHQYYLEFCLNRSEDALFCGGSNHTQESCQSEVEREREDIRLSSEVER